VNPALLALIVERIEKLNQQGVSFLLIEHNMELVQRLCRPVMVMAQGRLLAHGDAQTVLADPQVVEAYLGTAA
jgi:branched-chain amino acid transport system ATP-binding protein